MFKSKKPIIREKEIIDQVSVEAKSMLLWGSNNSGKSVLSTLIAKKLIEKSKNKNVALVYTDEATPIMQCLFPTNCFNTTESIGTLFTPIKITKELLFQNLSTLKKYNGLGILGFKNYENYAQYPECNEDLAKQLINILKDEFDYLIIDGSTTFIYNQLTSVAFNEVDICLKVATQDLKSESYFASNETFLDTVDISKNREIVLLNKIDKRGVYQEVWNKANSYDYKLPYSEELNDIVERGNLLLDVKDIELNKELDRLIMEVF